jgi:hypothetical protein
MSGFVESIAALPSPDGTSDDLWIVVRRTVGDSEVRHVEVMGQPFEPVHPRDKAAMSFLDSALRYQGPPAAALSGLHHLEGHTVSIVADGALHPERRVASGRVTLQAPARNVWVGLGYESRMRTLRLDLPPPSQAQGRTRRIARLTVRVHNAIGGEAGPGEGTKMETLVHRDLADPLNASPPMRSGDFDIYPASDFGQDARISIRQREPMPLDILSVMPVISVSGD